MSTRSYICLQIDESYGARPVRYQSIYCHWDGYPSHNGRILLRHYQTLKKVKELLALGDLSLLEKKTKPRKGQEHSYELPANGVCVAYHRDRGEAWEEVQPQIRSLDEMADADYVYIFDGKSWSVYSFANYDDDEGKVIQPLTPELTEEK